MKTYVQQNIFRLQLTYTASHAQNLLPSMVLPSKVFVVEALNLLQKLVLRILNYLNLIAGTIPMLPAGFYIAKTPQAVTSSPVI